MSETKTDGVDALEAELAAVRQRLEIVTAESAQLRVDLGIWEAEALRRGTAILDAHKATASVQAENAGLRSRIAETDAVVAGLRSDLARLNDDAETYSLISDGRERDHLRAELEHARVDATSARHGLDEAQARVAWLEREMVRRANADQAKQRGFWRRRNDPLAADVDLIEEYLCQYDWLPLMAPGPDGRTERVRMFLLIEAEGIEDLPFFNASEYRARYAGAPGLEGNALLHFIRQGARQGWNLHPLIDTAYYYGLYPDAPGLEMEAAIHYVRLGADKGYNPHPLFDTRFYLERYSDVAAARVNPLAHYLRFGGCDPHPLFDSRYYLTRNPDVGATGENPLVHYLTTGAAEGRDPHPLFDTRFYLETYPDVAASGTNPLVHYVTEGAAQGRWPNPRFNGAAYLRVHPEASRENPLVHRIRNPAAANPPAVLMIDACYPRPDSDSGSLDQMAYIRIFQSLGFKVFFAADVELGVESRYRTALEALGVNCVVYPAYTSIEAFLAAHGRELSLCFLSRVHFGARHIDAIRNACPCARIIFNTVDLHFVRERREGELKNDAAALVEAEETRSAELSAALRADATIVVSASEHELLRQEVPKANVFMVPLIRDYEPGRRAPFEARSGIGFIGGFTHAPNLDAIIYFLDEIWPLVRARMPDAEFFVIGPNLPAEVAARGDVGVTCVGFVEDLEPWLNRLRLTVAPLRYGAGAKGKVVSSLAYGVPCVTSPIAAEGMGLRDRVHVDIGGSAAEFADRVVSLYADGPRWVKMSDAGIALVGDRYSIGRGIELFRGILDSFV
jgi:glycosyltransferase involved in cell wall biosynthesis